MDQRMFVLTGGPASGKTTLARRLAAEGFPVVPEAAALVLGEGDAESLRRDPLELQRLILRRQLELETEVLGSLTDGATVFADRGVGDNFGYLRAAGLDPFDELLEAWQVARSRYLGVFVLEPGPAHVPTSERPETPERARHLHDLLGDEYLRRHSRVVPIPWTSVDRRVELVLTAVADTGEAMPPRAVRDAPATEPSARRGDDE